MTIARVIARMKVGSVVLFRGGAIVQLLTSENIYAITQGHAPIGIFIISEERRGLSNPPPSSPPPLGLRAKWRFPFPSVLFHLIFPAFDISHLSDPITGPCRLAKQRMLPVTYDRYRLNFRARGMPWRCRIADSKTRSALDPRRLD